MMRRLSVMLVDDHALVRAGYARLLAAEEDLHIVGAYPDADAAYGALLAAPERSDVMLLDLSLPGRSGLDLLRRVRARWSLPRVLVCSMHDAPVLVQQALTLGAAGFVTKNCDPALLAPAIRDVAAGRRVLSPDVARLPVTDSSALTGREIEVLQRLAHGHDARRIADELALAPKTVANVQTAIRAKLKAGNAVELLLQARRLGLIVAGP
jgi:DNA-binding NarL/FixJ family response regulator